MSTLTEKQSKIWHRKDLLQHMCPDDLQKQPLADYGKINLLQNCI